MNLFSGIEKSIERGFQRWTERLFGAAESNELLLTHRAILAEIQTKIETLARGRRLFPFATVVVTIVSPDANRRAMLETAFGERLEADVREALQAAACEIPRDFSLEVRTTETGSRPFEIDYAVAPAKAVQPAQVEPAKAVRLIVTKGKTERPEYELRGQRMNIGRMAELTDSEHRVVRRNAIVFEEGADEASATVSRKHAHIRFEDGE